jgi:anti-anti-sigma factor
MADTQEGISVREHDGKAIIDLRGNIDAFVEAALIAAYVEAGSVNPDSVMLNFSQVEYINSTGIALIVSILGRARKDNRSVVAYGLTDHYTEIFEITRLSDFMEIVADENAALETS